MKPYKPLLAVAILVLAALACQTLIPSQTQSEPIPLANPTQPGNPIPFTEADVPRISVTEAKTALDAGSAILVDVRSAEDYAAGHAAGSISIPLDNFESNIGGIPLEKNQWIITYCT
ncbi:MAG TPA: rhodanese-like domain-containing protein [Anaerolineales bacterium]|nr:rhodanese-like domain-containing protein [Anaerolineales bacterium]